MDNRVTRESTGAQQFGGRYQLLETIGRGRNSVVYKARISAPGAARLPFSASPVALKIIAPTTRLGHQRGFDQKQAELLEARVKREALAMLACRHPNVVRLFDYVTSPQQSYVVMEYVDHHDLKTVFSERFAPLPAPSALKIILQVLTGLDAIHRQGVIHRDIKPENLLLTSGGTVKIADFGIAVLPLHDDSMADANNGIGTFDYLAPEALEEGICSVSSDLYALGITCYQLLTGHMPFAAETFTAEITNKLLGRRIPLEKYLPEHPPYLEQLLDRALAPDPVDRFGTAAEFSSVVLQCLEGTWQPGPRRPARPRQSLRSLMTPGGSTDIVGGDIELTDHFTSSKVLEAISEGSMETAYRRQGYFGIKGGAGGRGNLSASPYHYVSPEEEEQNQRDREIVKVQTERAKRRTWSTFTFKFEQLLKNKADNKRRGLRLLLIIAGLAVAVGSAALFAPGGYDLGLFGRSPDKRQQPVVDEIHVGVLFGLLEDDSDASLIITVHPDRPWDARLAVGVPGWLPVPVDYPLMRTGAPVEARGSGLALTLRDGRVTGEGISGTYQDAASGRKGRWVIWER